MRPAFDEFSAALERLLAGEPASLTLAAGADEVGLPNCALGDTFRASRIVGPIQEVVTVGGTVEAVADASRAGASGLAGLGARVALCEICTWGVDPMVALQRARRADLLLQHELHQLSVGILNPETEVVSEPGSVADRVAEEAKAIQHVESGDLSKAGFASFEIDGTREDRHRWLEGLVRFANDLCPSSAAIELAVRATTEGTGFEPQVASLKRTLEALRSEILAVPATDKPLERALYVCELSMKVLCNLAWPAKQSVPIFDRDTGWWIVPSALGGASGKEREGWMNALFPGTAGVWQ